MIRTGLLIAVAAAVFTAAATASIISFRTVATGKTFPVGAKPVGYLSLTRSSERTWFTRLSGSSQNAVAGVPFDQRAIVAVFLDGMPCASNIAASAITRSGAALTVHVSWTRPPIGMAMCIRTSTAYIVLTVPRRSLGATPPTRVAVLARARA